MSIMFFYMAVSYISFGIRRITYTYLVYFSKLIRGATIYFVYVHVFFNVLIFVLFTYEIIK